MATEKQLKYWKSLIGNAINKGRKKRPGEGFQKGHSFIKGGEKGWFKKGEPSPRKGTGFKEERICLFCRKEYIGTLNNGKKYCSRKCMGHALSKNLKINRMFGVKNPQWKGGITTENKKIKYSKEYSEWRKKVFTRDNYTCQKCRHKGGSLHPHHIKNFAEYHKLRFVVKNGITLCEECHKLFHKKYGKKNNNINQIKQFLCQKHILKQ